MLGKQGAIMKLRNNACILYNIATQGEDQQGLVVMDRHKGKFSALLISIDPSILYAARSQVK
jgi:hypothetical protein